MARFCLNMVFHELQGADHIMIIKLASSVEVIRTTELCVGLLVISLPSTCFVASANIIWLDHFWIAVFVIPVTLFCPNKSYVSLRVPAYLLSTVQCIWGSGSILNITTCQPDLHRMAQPLNPPFSLYWQLNTGISSFSSFSALCWTDS